MGKFKPWDDCSVKSSSDESIYIFPPNKYGYQINISHPKINKLYRRYLKWKGIPEWCPLSDKERFEFEAYIFDLVDKGKIKGDLV